jgi:hypothetical protein
MSRDSPAGSRLCQDTDCQHTLESDSRQRGVRGRSVYGHLSSPRATVARRVRDRYRAALSSNASRALLIA